MHFNKRGSGLFVVLIVLTATAFAVYAVMDFVNGERDLNAQNEAHVKAKLVAESMLQAATAKLHRRLENSSVILGDALGPEKDYIPLGDDFWNLYQDSDEYTLVKPVKRTYTDTTQFFSEPTELIYGRITPPSITWLDGNRIEYQHDPERGKSVQKRALQMFAKATVEAPHSQQKTVYARQILEIRETALFYYAIYYNLPMEIAPGPNMDVYGDVHVNGDAWFQSGAGNSLNFYGRVTIAGHVHYGRHPDSRGRVNVGEVNFVDSNDNLINMEKNPSWPTAAQDMFAGTWLESSADNFRELADQIWDGNLRTIDHDVARIQLAGVSEYIEDTNPHTNRKEAFNSSYTLIQPVLNEIMAPSPSEDPEGYERAENLKAAERHKFAYKAGLTIEIGDDGSPSYYTYERDSYNDIVYDDDGSPKKIPLTPAGEFVAKEIFTIGRGEIQKGLYDKRQGKNMNLIEVDVSVLKDLVHSDDSGRWGGDDLKHKPENWWNGVVYVKFPQESASSSRPDNVNPARSRNWGVKLINGETIPNPSFAHSRGEYGMSIATNQVMYVEGNYNSDGIITEDSSRRPDNRSAFNQEGQEAPAALAADAITFLSEAWNDANSNKGLNHRVAKPTEVSAAILTGLVPSGKNGSKSYSGGVENFPRFLENWRNKDFAMRGSIVAMFESEVATKGWGAGDVYKAPIRNWGYHENYRETPPQGPSINSYRVINFELLSQSEYRDLVNLNW